MSEIVRSKPANIAEIFLTQIREAQEYTAVAMVAAQIKIEEQANRKINPELQIRVGVKLWLNLKNISTPRS